MGSKGWAAPILLACALLVAGKTSARDRTPRYLSESEEPSPLSLSFIIGANLWASLSGSAGRSSNRISLLAGAEAYYFFTPNVGIFLGGQYTSRGERTASGASASASFVDVPFGICFRHGSRIFGSRSQNQFSLGGFYAVPLGNLSVTNTQTRAAAGIILMGQTLFPIGESTALGFGTWGKFGVSEVVVSDASAGINGGSALEWGIGLVLGF